MELTHCGEGTNRTSSFEVFHHLFTPEMMKRIVQCTNARVEIIKNNPFVCFIATQKSVWSNLIGHVT